METAHITYRGEKIFIEDMLRTTAYQGISHVSTQISHDYEPDSFFSQHHTIRIFLVLQL
jgi:hypothetical protein